MQVTKMHPRKQLHAMQYRTCSNTPFTNHHHPQTRAEEAWDHRQHGGYGNTINEKSEQLKSRSYKTSIL